MSDAAPRTLIELLDRTVMQHGSRTALITWDERWSYEQLGAQVDRYARALLALGATKGTRVGLLMENRLEWIAFALAAVGIGAILVPISTFSRRDDLRYYLRHADIEQLFMTPRFLKNDYLAMLLEIAPELESATPGALNAKALPALRRVVLLGAGVLPAGSQSWVDFEMAGAEVCDADLREHHAAVDPSDDCYLLYTSGTTADPKGVVQVHEAVARNGWQIGEYQAIEPADVVWFYFPLFFSAGCINVMLGTLSHGAALILQPAFEPGLALALIEREKATTWHLWPHMLKELMEHPDWDRRDHSLLHKGTAPFDVMLDRLAEDGLGGVTMYGMTETCTAFSCTHASEAPDIRVGTNGRLMPGNQMKIVDPDTGAELPAGTDGEICVKGPSVLRCYHKIDPANTFDAEGFFHTGDLGHIDAEGYVHFKQRIKDMIKTGGINVSPAEIEAKLVELPGVAAAYAFPLPSEDRGEVVGTALVPEAGQLLTDADLSAHCESTLPGYKRPQGILVLPADRVPTTGSGKVQKVMLRELLLARMKEQNTTVVRLS